MRSLILLVFLFSLTAEASIWQVTDVSCQDGQLKTNYFLQPGAEVSDRLQEYHPLVISHKLGAEIEAIFIDDPRDPDRACENTTRPTQLTISLTKIQ